MTYEEIAKLADESGFSHTAPLDVSTIELRPEVRAACEQNTCNMYDLCWSCPPACGTLEECGARIKKYTQGIILQSSIELEDSFDFEGIMELGERHNNALEAFTDAIRKIYPDCLVLGAGGCKRCKKCTYPDAPCRFPEKQLSSMEGYGMVVNEVCQKNNIPYNYGKDTMTYVGCALFE